MENTEFKYSKFKALTKIQKFFKLDTFNSTIKKEIIGGLTTFLSMAYILSVAPSMLSQSPSTFGGASMNQQGIFLSVVIASFICTMIMGLFANIPAALSTSMGLMPIFIFTLATKSFEYQGVSSTVGFEGALIASMLSSIAFLLCSITPIRAYVVYALPKSLKIAIGVSIGFFIAYIGLADMDFVEKTGGLPIAKLSNLKNTFPMIILGFITLAIMLFLYYKKIPGATIIAIMIGFVGALIIANLFTLKGSQIDAFNNTKFENIKDSFKHYSNMFSGFKYNLSQTYKAFGQTKIWANPTIYICAFMMMFLNFFDATGTLTAFSMNLDKKTGKHPEISHRALIVDSASTLIGTTALGTSPMGVFSESFTGLEQGARTGLASVVTALLFLISIIFAPIFTAIPQCVTSSALIFVGIMMIGGIKDIEWQKTSFMAASFFSILLMITTYSIVNGIAAAVISYTFLAWVTKKEEENEMNIFLIILSIIFIIYFVAYAFIQ
ncbi:NCS2 family permease [Spiroplasma endosymbiont of Crioceris asparagi]|uniref:NCS2 family permease n=1 Tax=Spiroplasma endosymbiont of Crioceris asparagi TaxID=3066286 RepID=UPI0030D05422